MAVHADQDLAEMEILPGVFLASDKANLDELVSHEDHPFKIFVGHAGWGAGQLEGELQQGAWRTTPATAEYVFHNGSDLWEAVSRDLGKTVLQSMLKLDHIPEDPTAN